jgi:hypothetical protein
VQGGLVNETMGHCGAGECKENRCLTENQAGATRPLRAASDGRSRRGLGPEVALPETPPPSKYAAPEARILSRAQTDSLLAKGPLERLLVL